MQTGIIELDDAGDHAIHPDGHQYRNGRQSTDLYPQRFLGNGTERDHDDFRRQDEIGANGTLDFVLLVLHQIELLVADRFDQLLVMRFRIGLGMPAELMYQFLGAFVAQIGTADQQQGNDQPRYERTDQQGRRHQNQFVDERAFAHRPHHRQFAVGIHATDLMRIQREIIAEHSGGLFGSDLGHHRHIVQKGRDVVKQGKQTGTGHGALPRGKNPP